jgi:hypothetical protein
VIRNGPPLFRQRGAPWEIPRARFSGPQRPFDRPDPLRSDRCCAATAVEYAVAYPHSRQHRPFPHRQLAEDASGRRRDVGASIAIRPMALLRLLCRVARGVFRTGDWPCPSRRRTVLSNPCSAQEHVGEIAGDFICGSTVVAVMTRIRPVALQRIRGAPVNPGYRMSARDDSYAPSDRYESL